MTFFCMDFLFFFDRMFRLTGFIFDIDDFHFRAYRKMGDAFPRAFLGFQSQIQKVSP